MKKMVFTLLLVLAVCGQSYAHPPSAINISYDPATKTLRAFIVHNVLNPEKHYIKQVVVKINDKEFRLNYFSKQDSLTGLTVSYVIPQAKAGDTLSIEAYCSISGWLKKELRLT